MAGNDVIEDVREGGDLPGPHERFIASKRPERARPPWRGRGRCAWEGSRRAVGTDRARWPRRRKRSKWKGEIHGLNILDHIYGIRYHYLYFYILSTKDVQWYYFQTDCQIRFNMAMDAPPYLLTLLRCSANSKVNKIHDTPFLPVKQKHTRI